MPKIACGHVESSACLVFRTLVAGIVVSILAAISWPAHQLGVALGFWQPIRRPPSVSTHARYIPAAKSAAWFDCSFGVVTNVDVCRAWDEQGRLVAHGKYRLDGENRAATERELRPSTVIPVPGHPELSWIWLFGSKGTFSKVLVPVNEAGQPLERFDVRLGTDAGKR